MTSMIDRRVWLGIGGVAAAVGIVVACDKSPSSGTITPPSDPSTAASPPPKAAGSPPSLAESAPPSTAAAEAPSATPGASASSKVATADGGKPKPGASGATTAVLKPASKRFTGNNFALDATSPGCKAAEECSVTLKLTPTGEFHVNKEYPYKFLATPAAGVSYLGKSDANSFGKQWGDYVEQGEKLGLLTVRFKAAAAGEARVTGKYKLSVCSAAQCLIEEQQVDLAVPVM
jgi:hypothetical protein